MKKRADPVARTLGASQVNRGGYWINLARYCRSALRNWVDPSDRYFGLGFRVAALKRRFKSEESR